MEDEKTPAANPPDAASGATTAATPPPPSDEPEYSENYAAAVARMHSQSVDLAAYGALAVDQESSASAPATPSKVIEVSSEAQVEQEAAKATDAQKPPPWASPFTAIAKLFQKEESFV